MHNVPHRRRALVVIAAGLAVTVMGCGANHPKGKILEGPVTTVNQQRVCVGGPNASGECFTLDSVTRNLQVKDCIRVRYTPDGSAILYTATSVQHLDAARNASVCPRE